MPIGRTLALAVAACATPAFAQFTDPVVIDLSGIEVAFPFNDQSFNSVDDTVSGMTELLAPAAGYQFALDGFVQVTSLGLPVFSGPVDDLFNQVEPGQADLLSGFVRNQAGPGAPMDEILIWRDAFGGELAPGIGISLSFRISVDPTGVVTLVAEDISSSLGFLLNIQFTSGSLSISPWTPTPAQLTEWHFDGDLSAAPGSDDSGLAFLDDPAFGTIFTGAEESSVPAPGTPTGVSAAQSMFTTTDAAGIAGPGGMNDEVLFVGPAFSLADPMSQDLRRGLGLALFPATRPVYPGPFVGQWTMIWDMYIPSSSWFADFPTNAVPREFVAALLNDDDSNGNGAELYIRNTGGNTQLVYTMNGDDFTTMPLNLPASVGPDQWFRLALVVDEFRTGTPLPNPPMPVPGLGRVFVNGAFAGEILADVLQSQLDPTPGNRRWADGQLIPDATFDTAWGGFPNPWSLSPETMDGGEIPIQTTATMFSDLRFGGSQPLYLANYLFVDDILPDSQVIGLGGPSADGIVLTGPLGCNAADIAPPFGMLDLSDVQTFLIGFGSMDPVADIAGGAMGGGDGMFDLQDVQTFLIEFGAGCP